MPRVFIPASFRKHTSQIRELTVSGSTVREVVRQLESQFPALAGKILQGDQLRPGLAVGIGTRISDRPLLETLLPEDEVHFLPSISGG